MKEFWLTFSILCCTRNLVQVLPRQKHQVNTYRCHQISYVSYLSYKGTLIVCLGELSGSRSLSFERAEYHADTAAELERLTKGTLNLGHETSTASSTSENGTDEQKFDHFDDKSSSEC